MPYVRTGTQTAQDIKRFATLIEHMHIILPLLYMRGANLARVHTYTVTASHLSFLSRVREHVGHCAARGGLRDSEPPGYWM
jgi:hypothetical protein